MTDKELQIKVAKLCGWERGPKETTIYDRWLHIQAMSCWHKKGEQDNWQDEPPDFPHDLNACHEMEEMLEGRSHWTYERLLKKSTGAFWWRATARQRCEAFCKVMEGAK